LANQLDIDNNTVKKNDKNKAVATENKEENNIDSDIKIAIKTAIARNNLIDSKKSIVNAQNSQKNSSIVSYLPSISVSYQSQKHNYEKGRFQSGNENLPERSQIKNSQAIIRQNLFDGFSTTNRLRSDSTRLKMSKQELILTQQQLMSNIAKSYFNISRLKDLMLNNQQEITTYQKHLDNTKIKLKNHEITKTDFHQVEINLMNANIKRDRLYAQFLQENYRIKQLMNIDKELDFKSNGSYLASKISALDRDINNIENNLANIIASNPKIKQSDYDAKIKKINKQLELANFMPKVDASLSHSRNYNSNNFRIYNQDERVASLIVSVPIFDFGKDKFSFDRASHEYSSAKAKYREDLTQIKTAIMSEIIKYKTNKAILKNNQENYLIANLIYENAMIEFKNGVKDNFELLYFINTKFIRNEELINSYFETLSSAFTVLEVSGLLNEEHF
jgi:adhesin transport system outer membrane protein